MFKVSLRHISLPPPAYPVFSLDDLTSMNPLLMKPQGRILELALHKLIQKSNTPKNLMGVFVYKDKLTLLR